MASEEYFGVDYEQAIESFLMRRAAWEHGSRAIHILNRGVRMDRSWLWMSPSSDQEGSLIFC